MIAYLQGVYRFRTRGRALIINIHNVRGSDERLGSEYDVRKLKDMFRKFQFQPQVYEDLNIQVSLSHNSNLSRNK